MELVIKHSTLLENLKLAVGMVKQKTLVTSAVELLTKDDQVFMQCTNFTEGLRSKLPGSTITEEGKTIIDTKRIFDIVSELSESEIIIKKESNHLKVISNEASKIKLLMIDEEFPENLFDDMNSEIEWIKITVNDLTELIKFSSCSAETDEIRQNIAGVYFESGDKSLCAVGVDGKRISYVSKEIPGFKDGIKSLIPNSAIKTIKSILETTKFEFVSVAFTDKKFYLKCKDSTFYTQTLSDNFPNFRAMFPEDDYPHNTISLKKDPLIQPLKRIQIIARETSTPTMFSITKNILTLSAENIKCGSIKEIIPIEYEDDDFSFLINGDYVLELISVFNKDINIEYDFTQDGKPMIFVPKDIDNVFTLIMPTSMN